MEKKKYYRTLTIAGSDSGGGAGIQADIKTFSALGCFGMSAIAALTAQNTVAVTGIYEVSPNFVAQQIDAVIEDIGVDAVKIGMLQSPEIIKTVADRLKYYHVKKIVLDPVMVAKSGDRLLREDAIDALKEELIPIAEVITPNIPEAEVLTNTKIEDQSGMEKALELLADLGARSVLVKGGHSGSDESSDCLLIKKDITGHEIIWIKSTRIESKNTHGTGCTLSSAIASYLAKGYNIIESVKSAKEYITAAIKAGAEYNLGKGHGPVHHFYNFWNGKN
ncbi:MAG: bifunctional hydroxymethylpyrimidine kinase/phosphomethylpyrimidine kinase [Ignavibacteria bacterium]|jgi:hydroxymethylpyrimidine/phosphomethylpyrimidine kinase